MEAPLNSLLEICIIDQACSVKMAGYWPSSFLRVYGPRRTIKDLLNGIKQHLSMICVIAGQSPYPERAR